uniref:Transferring glycosyl group transferase n=1 Tax=Lotus japonicus TaxID=34305 RepID=I3S3L7_LOTJA|nr:unknown [Lotus japonicus]
MAESQSLYLCLLLFLFLHLLLPLPPALASSTPTPTAWPHQFHSVLFINSSGNLQKTDLWYDWPNGRNFNIIQHQLGVLKYDLEWNNGTSFYYTLDPFNHTCKVIHFDVGILRPNWLDGANYLGQHYADNFLCNVWEKVDFIWYYEDVLTRRPVKWIFYSGMIAHVMTFEVGAVLEDAQWQAPVYCFNEAETHEKSSSSKALLDSEASGALGGSFMREITTQHAYVK